MSNVPHAGLSVDHTHTERVADLRVRIARARDVLAKVDEAEAFIANAGANAQIQPTREQRRAAQRNAAKAARRVLPSAAKTRASALAVVQALEVELAELTAQAEQEKP